jgi:NitT/TauT family transport system ATP-binding protein
LSSLAPPLLALRGVGYAYESGVKALDTIDVDLDAGSVTAVIGPSGCGKSTILAILAGLRKPLHGIVEWSEGGKGDRGNGPRLTLMFQKDTLLPWLTVEDNVGFGLRYVRDLDKQEARSRIERLLGMAGLSHARKMYPYQLSGGMRRRVALLMVVAPYPKVLLLDEPFSSLDEPSRVSIHADLLSIVHELGITAVIVTHDLGEALSLSDRIVVLSKGPATVVKTREVPFGSSRDVFHLREDADYQELYAELWAELSAQSWSARTARTGAVSQ